MSLSSSFVFCVELLILSSNLSSAEESDEEYSMLSSCVLFSFDRDDVGIDIHGDLIALENFALLNLCELIFADMSFLSLTL